MEKCNTKRASGKRAKKRRFYGNRFTSKLNVSEINVPDQSSFNVSITSEPEYTSSSAENYSFSASKRKISNPCAYQSNLTDMKGFQGYILMDKDILISFLNDNLVCKDCCGPVNISSKNTMGLYCTISISCEMCQIVYKLNNSKMIGDKKNIPEVNRRIVYAMRCIGQGLEPLKTFCGVMDLGSPVTQNAYDKICKRINEASKIVAIESMKNAAIEEASQSSSNAITVSGDGTWKTRGHTSHIGVCTLIGAETGKLIDAEVLSTSCKGCETWKGKRCGEPFEEWKAMHSSTCMKNHTGSSCKMEVDGMIKIFHRSQSERGVQYINYIGDGDAKTFSSIVESKPYGDLSISKLECVGHIQKRMGNRLRKLKCAYKSQKLEDGKSLSGKGRLTDVLINKLTVYYGNAIRQNSNSLDEMRKAVWAVYFHTRSTDAEPLHSFCPTGANSWCRYQQAVADGSVNRFHHKNSLPSAVMDILKPVFRDLSNPILLKRCLGSHTQNPNESFHSLLWHICPKTSGSGKMIAEIAVYEAAVLFNEGKKGRLSVMRSLGIHPGINAIKSQFYSDIKRIKSAERKVKSNTLDARRARKRAKIRLTTQQMEKENILYEAGGF